MRTSLGVLFMATSVLLAACSQPENTESETSGWNVVKLHTEDELDLVMSTSIGPNLDGSSADIGDISDYKGLLLEWQMQGRPEVFQQVIYVSPEDKDVITGNVEAPEHHPKRYTTILSDGFGTMMWLGVSIQGSRLYLSTNSQANATPRLQRIYGIL